MFLKRITAAALTATAVAAAVVVVSHEDATAAPAVPAFDHIVLVMFENQDYKAISDSSKASYFNKLAAQGAKFTKSFGTTHPSQPNYISLFSGSTYGVDNDCTDLGNKENLATQLTAAKKTFAGYAESMPSEGYTGCESGELYARRHNSWVSFSNVPKSSNRKFSSFPTDYSKLPTVSFVTPDLCSDMHDCSISTGDKWLKKNLDAYAQWAKTHNSLLIVTFDEDSASSSVNQIFTTFVGAHVKPGNYSKSINHYAVLRTIEAAYGLPGLGEAAKKSPISDVWN